jgi:hypothetical protein
MAARIANMANTNPAIRRGLEGLPDMNREQGRDAAQFQPFYSECSKTRLGIVPGQLPPGWNKPFARATILDSYAAFRRTW